MLRGEVKRRGHERSVNTMAYDGLEVWGSIPGLGKKFFSLSCAATSGAHPTD